MTTWDQLSAALPGGPLPWIALGALGLLLLLALRLAALRRRRILRQLDPRRITLKDIDGMLDGSDFERYLHRLFEALGYAEVHRTSASGDFGADLVYEDRYGARTVLQAKRYAMSNPVGLSAVQEVYGSMRVYGAQRAVVLTSGRYTAACRKLAAYNGVVLLDREDLDGIIAAFKSKRPEEAMETIEREAEETPGELRIWAGSRRQDSAGRDSARRDRAGVRAGADGLANEAKRRADADTAAEP